MAKVQSIFKKPADYRIHKPCENWVLPNQLIGLEFEAEQVVVPPESNLLAYYHMKGDGSLRDNGMEFVFINPYMGEDMNKALTLMSKASKNWSLSERCGLHVHLDVRDMENHLNLYRLFLLYSVFEYVIYRFIGDNRDKNNFCIPWFRTYEQHGVMAKIMACKDEDEQSSTVARQAVERASRYMGLNLNSLIRFGSLEFRQMQNTHDFERITNWINIIMQLKKSALQSTVIGDEFLNEVTSAGLIEFLKDKMPLLYELTRKEFDLYDLLRDGLDVCTEICISTEPVQYFNNGALQIQKLFAGESKALSKFIAKRNIKVTTTSSF